MLLFLPNKGKNRSEKGSTKNLPLLFVSFLFLSDYFFPLFLFAFFQKFVAPVGLMSRGARMHISNLFHISVHKAILTSV